MNLNYTVTVTVVTNIIRSQFLSGFISNGVNILNSETQEGVSNTENSREHSGIGSGWYKNPDVWTSLAC